MHTTRTHTAHGKGDCTIEGAHYALPAELRHPVAVGRAIVRSGRLPEERPLLLMDRDELTKKVRLWRRYLPGVKEHYAIKCNPDPLVLDVLNQLGSGFDVASEGEMIALARLKVEGKRMILSHPDKELDAIIAMNRYKPWAFTVDDLHELKRVREHVTESADYRPVTFVRFAVPKDTGGLCTGVTSDLNEKFGCAIPDVLPILEEAHRLGFKELGIGYHPGTQGSRIPRFQGAMALAETLANKARVQGLPVKWIDIGGGFPDSRVNRPPLDESLPADMTLQEAIFAASGKCTSRLIRAGYRVIGEPGRGLVADAGTAVMMIRKMKERNGMPDIRATNGTYGLFLGQCHDEREWEMGCFRVNERNRPLEAKTRQYQIWGPTCDSWKKLKTASGLALPANLEPGDFLAVPHAGAYTSSSKTHFNYLKGEIVVVYFREDAHTVRWYWRDKSGKVHSAKSNMESS